MNVSNVETMKGDRVVIAAASFGVAGLSILFCFCELSNNGDPEEFLSGHLDGKGHRLFILELDVADTTDG